MAITFDENERRMRQASRNVWKRPPVPGAAPSQYGGSDMPHGPVSPSAPQYSDSRAVAPSRGPMPAAEMPKPVMTPGAPPPGTAVGPSLRPDWAPPNPGGVQYSSGRELAVPGTPQAAPGSPQALPAPQQQSLGSKLRGAVAGVEPVVSGALAGAGGAATAAMVNNVRQGQLNTAPKMGPRPDAPGQIPVNPADVAPPAAAGSFMNQSETLRNVGNMAMALPGGRGMVNGIAAGAEALPRVAAALGKLPLLDRAAQPAALAGAAVKGYAAGDAAFPGVAPAALPAPETLRQPYIDPLGGDRGGSALPPKPVLAPGQIVKTVGPDGKVSYGSSGGAIADGATMVDPTGKVLEPRGGYVGPVAGGAGGGAGSSGGGNYLGSPAHQQRILESTRSLNTAKQDAAIREQNLRDGKPEDLGTSTGPVGMGGSLQSNWYKEEADARSREMDFKQSLRDMSPRQQAQAIMQERELQNRAAVAAEGNATQRRGQDIGASTTLRGQDIGASTSRYGTDVSASTQRRGQDFELAGREVALRSQGKANELAAQKFAYDQRKDAITYADGRSDKALEQRYAGEKALDDRLASRFQTTDPVSGKPVPDAPRIAQYRQQFDVALADLQRRGQKVTGVHDLGPQAQEQLIAATDLLARLRADGSVWNPLKPDQAKSVNAIDIASAQRDPKSGDYVVTRKGPMENFVIPARYFETKEAHRLTLGGLRGTPTTEYDILKGQ